MEIVPLTKLNLEHVAPVVGFDPHDLIFVTHVQGELVVRTDGHMEDGRTHIGDTVESRVVVVFLGNELSATESILWLRRIPTGNENGGVVNRDRHRLFDGVR